MSGDTSERKTDPASRRKLQKLREKGQVAQAVEISNYASQVLVFAFLILGWPWLVGALQSGLETSLSAAPLPLNAVLTRVSQENVALYVRLV